MSRQELSLYWSVFVVESSWGTSVLTGHFAIFSSEVGFPDQLSFLSDDFSLEIELISHQKQSKVHLQNELWKFYLYTY